MTTALSSAAFRYARRRIAIFQLAPGTKIPPGSLALGSPARVKRPLTDMESRNIRESAANYVGDIETYLD